MWIIPNNYQPSSASVLDTLGSKEDLSLQGLNIESSLMWRSKPSPLRTWSQRWSKVSWFRLLSTRILKPSHLISFETQLTSSLEDIRANRLAWQEERKPLTIPDTSSPTSSTMCEQLDLFSASSRTSKDTSTGDSNQSSKTWKAQVTIQRGEYSQRKKLAHLTKGNASSFLPTPTATPYGNNQGGAAGRTGQVRHSLESMAKHDLWPTPTLHGNYNRKGASQNSGDGLETAVKKELWPTPTATERSGTNPKTGKGHGLSKAVKNWPTPTVHYDSMYVNKSPNKEKRHSNGLATQVDQLQKNWPTPSTRDHKGGYKGGRIRNGKVSMDTLDVAVQHTDNKDQTSGTLNPTWVEWLMGLPTGWTDLDSWVTELSPKQPPEHGRS